MLNKKLISVSGLSPGTIATLALFDHIHSKQPEKIKTLLEKHEQYFSGNPGIDFLQTMQLSRPEDKGGRGRFFTEDFADVAKSSNYNNLGNLAYHLSFSGEDLAGVASSGAAAAAGGGLNIAADIAALNSIKNLFHHKPKPVEIKDTFFWPPENEFPKERWNTQISDPNTSLVTLQSTLEQAQALVKEYDRQTKYHSGRGDSDNAKNTSTWMGKAQEFVDELNNKIEAKKSGTHTNPGDLKDIFSQTNPNLDDRDAAQKLKDKMAQDDKDNADDKILGIDKKKFITGAVVTALIIVLAVVAWLWWKNKKKKAEVAKG